MSSRPFIQFYCADFLGDTVQLDAAQTGAFLCLILHQWQTGKPIPERHMTRVMRIEPGDFHETCNALREYFLIHPNGDWENLRVTGDLSTFHSLQIARSAAGRKGAAKTWKDKNKAKKVTRIRPDFDGDGEAK